MNKSFCVFERHQISSPRDSSLIKLFSECVTSFFCYINRGWQPPKLHWGYPITAKICFPLKARVLIPCALLFHFPTLEEKGPHGNFTQPPFTSRNYHLGKGRALQLYATNQKPALWQSSRTRCLCPCCTTDERLPIPSNFQNKEQNTTNPSCPWILHYNIGIFLN